METVAAADILNAVGDRAALTRGEMDVDLFATLRGSLSRRLREAWRAQRWPELMRLEQRYFRPLADPLETIAAGVERFVPSTGRYYQALKAGAGFPVNSLTGDTQPDWAASETVYTAEFWLTESTYAVGDQVRYEQDGFFYQMHTAAVAGTVPTDATAWGRLTEFDRYVAYEQAGKTALGELTGVWAFSPHLTMAPRPLSYSQSMNGAQVLGCVPWVWIEYRVRPPTLRGDLYDPTRGYAAGRQVYFIEEEDGLPGDFYTAAAETMAAQDPETFPELWVKAEIPLRFELWLVSAVYADYLETEGQKDKSTAELAAARGILEEEMLVMLGQEGQGGVNDRMEVATR